MREGIMVIKTIPIFVLAIFMQFAFADCRSVSKPTLRSDADIRQILVDRIDHQHQSVGIVVGLIGPEGRRVIAYGRLEKGDLRPLTGDTIFEIGSETKVFTSLLLADMVQRGEVTLGDPVAKYLPPGAKMPERNGHSITLVDLATHTSGLPRLPTNMSPKDPANPYADYSVEQLYQFLAGYQLTRDIGSQYEYSNLGGGLLGHVLALRAGMSYEALIESRICAPLGMNSTGITLTSEMNARLAVGHNAALETVENWDLPTLAGAGALRSTANDMLTFIAGNLGYTKSPLAPAMAAMLKERRPTGQPDLEMALGWHIFTTGGKEIIWHNGGTGGYRSFMGFDPKVRVGVVLLSNAETSAGVDDIGRHLLDPGAPSLTPREHKQVTVDPKLFDGYVGTYQLAPNFIITITRDGDHLFEQATGQPKFEIFPEGDRIYFLKVVDAQITFITDSQGHTTELVLHQNGRDAHGTRLKGDAPPPKERKQIVVAQKVFDGYVGRYQLAPNFVLTITREDDHFFEQATGQPKAEIFAESDHDYFLKIVDAQITFVTESNGHTTELILHQGGFDQHAKRIE
jgi:serine-type D-Ala-D-Ala carboxypeptidase/endopeptidase